MRHFLINLSLLPLALAVSVPAMGQQSSGQPTSDREQEQSARQSRQAEQRDSRSRRGERPDQRRRPGRQQAVAHYRSGFAAGYLMGYADGLDDYVVIIGTPSRESQTAGDSRSQEQRLRGSLRQRARQRAMQGSRGQQARTQQVAGEIRAMKQVQLRNDNQRHLLLLVETQQGKKRIVDAGPVKQVSKKLSLQQGDRITARGSFLRTRDGVPVLNARQVASQGERVAIESQSSERQRQQQTRR